MAADSPGYGVSGSMTTTPATMMARPSQVSIAAALGGVRSGSRRSPTAMSAPTPSCHARVGNEKKAHGAAMSVQTTASQKDITAMSPTTMPSRPGRRSRRHSPMISGQNR